MEVVPVWPTGSMGGNIHHLHTATGWQVFWYSGSVLMTLSALMNLATAVINYSWTCLGVSVFGWEMDVVYGKLFFTYGRVPFSKIEGSCALCLAIGGFMSWIKDPAIQCVALLLQIFGCGYWIVCICYALLIKDTMLGIVSSVVCSISLGFSLSRGPLYCIEKNSDLAVPFWTVTGVILGISLVICLMAYLTMNEEKQQLVDRMHAIKAWVAQNDDYKWPVENAHSPEGAPDGFEATQKDNDK